jgi:hypothetical protein
LSIAVAGVHAAVEKSCRAGTVSSTRCAAGELRPSLRVKVQKVLSAVPRWLSRKKLLSQVRSPSL